MMKVYCTPHSGKLLGDVFREFFLKEVGESGPLYVVSPWITESPFDPPLVYHPFLNASDSVEALIQLAERGKEVFIVTRYYDDMLRAEKVVLWYEIRRLSIENPHLFGELYMQVKEEIESVLSRIKALERLANARSVHVKYNPRIHAKIYVGSKQALIGSANFTRNSLENWNDECLLLATEDEDVYWEVRSYAENYFRDAVDEKTCLEGFLKSLSRVGLRVPSASFEDFSSVKKFLLELVG